MGFFFNKYLVLSDELGLYEGIMSHCASVKL